jgi:hypothetical protein
MSDGVSAPLREIKALLEDAEIPYMIVGSFASMVHGEPRTTQDLDIVIDPQPAALDHFLAHIDTDAFYVDPDTARDALRRRAMFNIIDMRSAWKIDLVMRKNRQFSHEELARRAEQEVLGVIVPTASAEDTIVAKLECCNFSILVPAARSRCHVAATRTERLESPAIRSTLVSAMPRGSPPVSPQGRHRCLNPGG